jgi:hypothetical protein
VPNVSFTDWCHKKSNSEMWIVKIWWEASNKMVNSSQNELWLVTKCGCIIMIPIVNNAPLSRNIHETPQPKIFHSGTSHFSYYEGIFLPHYTSQDITLNGEVYTEVLHSKSATTSKQKIPTLCNNTHSSTMIIPGYTLLSCAIDCSKNWYCRVPTLLS